MTAIDYQTNKNYSTELLNYIHSEVGLINCTKERIISLIKEQKRASKANNKEYTIQSFESSMNFLKVEQEKLNHLKHLIDLEINDRKVIKKIIFCVIAYDILNIDYKKVSMFLNISYDNFYVSLNKYRKIYKKDLVFTDMYTKFAKKHFKK
jgi:hypothetical protein